MVAAKVLPEQTKKADAALIIENRGKNHQRLVPVAAVRRGEDLRLPACLDEQGKARGDTWGHDTFMCGPDFLNLNLR